MAQSSRGVRPIEPVNMLFKPLKADFKELFKALAKAVTHGVSGKWAELGSDAADALSSFGISTDPGELAHIIIIRALSAAIFELVGESANLFTLDPSVDEEGLSAYLGDLLSSRELLINARFLDRPGDIAITQDLKTCLGIWLERHGILPSSSSAIVDRLPSYFVFSLNQEWRRNSKSYEPLIAALQTPFTQAGDREWGWSTYFALLERRINESIFD